MKRDGGCPPSKHRSTTATKKKTTEPRHMKPIQQQIARGNSALENHETFANKKFKEGTVHW